MGFTGGLVRSVFSGNCSAGSHESKVKRNTVENRRWVSVRTYLCGDEFNSVLAEEDSASVKSSEFTITQPTQEDLTGKEEAKSEETVENRSQSNSKLLNEEAAAIVIQSAYRAFLVACDEFRVHGNNENCKVEEGRMEENENHAAMNISSSLTSLVCCTFQLRRQNEEIRSKTGKEELNLVIKSPDRSSLSTSIEVQTGNSSGLFSVEGETMSIYQQRTRTQVIKQKDWDDSTVSSYVAKMRMQNRMEATTRRERALAYAFSQQLRICSKRNSTKYNSMEPNMSWSWLERWMATRLPDTSSVESHSMKQYDPFNSNHKFAIKTRFLDAAREEKESCGSNEVPLHFDNYSVSSKEEKVSFKPPKAKTNFKARRTVSRRKTVPSYQFPEEQTKVSKRDGSSTAGKDIKQKQKEVGSSSSRTEMKFSTLKPSNE